MKRKALSLTLALCFVFSLFNRCGIHVFAERNTQELSVEMLDLIEKSKYDKGDKIDDNIFDFKIVNIESINCKLTKVSDSNELDSVINEINNLGLTAITVTGYNRDVSFVIGNMSERNNQKDCRNHYVNDGRTGILLFEQIKINCVYTVNIVIKKDDGGLQYFSGNYGIGINEDNTLYSASTIIDTTFLHENNKDNIVYLSSSNVFNLDSFSERTSICGKISDSSYIFTYTATNTGFVDFITYSPDGIVPHMEIKKMGNMTSLDEIIYVPEYLSANSMFVDTQVCRFQVHKNEQYAVIISAKSANDIGADYTLSFQSTVQPLWYPQWMSVSADGTVYWDSTNLGIANSGYNGNSYKIFINYPTNSNNFVLKQACYLVGTSLILANKNLSLLSEKYDVRLLTAHTSLEYSNFQSLTPSSVSVLRPYRMFADPYSVLLANNSLSGKHYTFMSGANEIYSYSPTISVSANYSAIYGNFQSGGTVHTYNLSGFTGTPSTDYNVLYNAISSALATHPEGILVSMGNHAIVVRLINGYPRVFDSGRNGNSIIGNYYNVPLYTYFVSARIRDISTITKYRTFD